jgi:hypothetical protein
MKTWSNRTSWKGQEEEFGMDKGSDKQGGKQWKVHQRGEKGRDEKRVDRKPSQVSSRP